MTKYVKKRRWYNEIKEGRHDNKRQSFRFLLSSMRKNKYSQTSRLENPEELQLNHKHGKFLFF
jgi:hypothetical protein